MAYEWQVIDNAGRLEQQAEPPKNTLQSQAKRSPTMLWLTAAENNKRRGNTKW